MALIYLIKWQPPSTFCGDVVCVCPQYTELHLEAVPRLREFTSAASWRITQPSNSLVVSSIFFAILAMALPETMGEKIPDSLDEGEQGWIFITFKLICNM